VARQLAQRGWSQADAARASGIPKAAFSQWINPRDPDRPQQPSIENVRKAAATFDVPVLQALVRAEYLTEEEANMELVPALPISDIPTVELIEEIRLRVVKLEDLRRALRRTGLSGESYEGIVARHLGIEEGPVPEEMWDDPDLIKGSLDHSPDTTRRRQSGAGG
jgi:transcriptional regulator with XRE-family HTH domain